MKFTVLERIIASVILGICSLIWIFPVAWAFFTSFKSKNEILSSLSLIHI